MARKFTIRVRSAGNAVVKQGGKVVMRFDNAAAAEAYVVGQAALEKPATQPGSVEHVDPCVVALSSGALVVLEHLRRHVEGRSTDEAGAS